MLLHELLELIDTGVAVPDQYRPLVIEVLRRSTIDQVLEVSRYRDIGLGLHKAHGGSYYLAGKSCYKSPSTCESSFQKYRYLLNHQ